MVLFSAKDLKTLAAEIARRQDYEGSWTDENGNEVELKQDNMSPVERAQQGINLFVDELMRRFYDIPDEDDISYYSDDTPRLTEDEQ